MSLPARCGLHWHGRRPAGINGAVQVSLHHRIQVGIANQCSGRLGKRPRTATGVADSHIESPPTLDDLLYRAVHGCGVGDIDFKPHRLPATRFNLGNRRVLLHRFALRGKVRVGFEAEIQHGHARAQRREPVRIGAPEPATRARHQGYLPLQLRLSTQLLHFLLPILSGSALSTHCAFANS